MDAGKGVVAAEAGDAAPWFDVQIALTQDEYLAGERLHARISFLGHGHVVDWAAVQVHGHVWRDPRLVVSATRRDSLLSPTSLPPSEPFSTGSKDEPDASSKSPTSASKSSLLGVKSSTGSKYFSMPDLSLKTDGSLCVFATKPTCATADLVLTNAEVVNFVFETRLPKSLPPSFKGVAVKYAYWLSLGVKFRSREQMSVAHVPLRIVGTKGCNGDAARIGLPLPGSPLSSQPPESSQDDEENEEDDQEYSSRFNTFPSLTEPLVDESTCLAETAWTLKTDSGELTPFLKPSLSRGGDGVSFFDATMDSSAKSDVVSTIALNVVAPKTQTAVARLYASPRRLRSGESLSVRIDLMSFPPAYRFVECSLELEERCVVSPPLSAAFEPFGIKKRRGAGPWVQVLSKVKRDVSHVVSCGLALCSMGGTPDFSTDLVVVRTYLVVEFSEPIGADASRQQPIARLRVPLSIFPACGGEASAPSGPNGGSQEQLNVS